MIIEAGEVATPESLAANVPPGATRTVTLFNHPASGTELARQINALGLAVHATVRSERHDQSTIIIKAKL